MSKFKKGFVLLTAALLLVGGVFVSSGKVLADDNTPTTGSATVNSSTEAVLSGTNGLGAADDASFWYGTTSAGPFTAEADPSDQFSPLVDWHTPSTVGAQTASQSFNQTISGLTSGTQYYFVAWVHVDGTWYPGAVETFTTTSDVPPPPAIPDCNASSFDGSSVGSVDGQDGWTSTGSFDQGVVDNTYGYDSFGCKTFRISNAVTSGGFGNQTFSPSNANEAGETSAVNGGMSGGARQNHYEAQFDIASATPDAVQTGLSLSVSPDRGDGSRMSYLRFEDQEDGIHVFFDDVTDAGPIGTTATFNESDIATLDRTAPHTVKFAIDFVDGPSNDVVKIYIDGTLKATGTSWEDYYRFDPEQAGNGNQVPTVDSLIFRAKDPAVPENSGKGFLFDNVNLSSTSVLPLGTPDCDASSFDNFNYGSVNGQNGWAAGSDDQGIVNNTNGYENFGCKSLRVSNAVATGGFGDQIFAAPLTDSVGETSSTAGSFSAGTKQNHYEVQFGIASAVPSAQQPGLALTVSPDRGDGSRMSFLRFEDQADGIHVFFDDVPGGQASIGTDDEFSESDIATLDRTAPHTIKMTFDAVDGAGNDIVKVYVDGSLVKTGTSWEDYYRFDPEASAEQSPRIVKTLLIRAKTSAPETSGKGFLFDNFSLSSSFNNNTSAATDITGGSAQLNGKNGQAGSADSTVFWYGTTPATFMSGSDVTDQWSALVNWHSSNESGVHDAEGEYSSVIHGLTPNTQYYFVAWAHVGGIWYPGEVLNFTTTSDITAPIINLIGSADMTITVGSTYVDAGATATDDVDTSVTVTSSGTVDTTTVGTYTITYSATDTAGNEATPVSRTVHVTEIPVVNHTITASAGANGSISPVGPVTVTNNSSQSFTITPDSGFHVEDVLVDGSSVGAVSSYNFTEVTGDHTITASFAPDETSTGGGGSHHGSSHSSGGTSTPFPVTNPGTGTTTPAPVGQVLGAEAYNFTMFLKMGPPYLVSSHGTEVMELQKFLNAGGFGPLVVDGKFGPLTKAAVIKFQLANGLKGDGIVGPLTRAVLNK